MMDDETPGTVVRRLLAENLRLHQKVFELEGKLQQYTDAATRDSTRISNIRKLLQQKDVTLEQHAAELEEKRAELQRTVDELQKRNEQLKLWMASLRLYQELFEYDREGMIAISPEGKIVLYNQATEEILGEKVKEMVYKSVDEADFGSFDPEIPKMVREALENHRSSERVSTIRGRRVTSTVFPLGRGGDFRGVLLKIGVVPAK